MPLSSITMRKGDRVRWYLMSSTNDFDFITRRAWRCGTA
jgi:hypothetical protein